MAKVIEEKEGGGGTIVFEPGEKSNPEVMEERQPPDNYTPRKTSIPEDNSNLKKLDGKEPTSGKEYFIEFNTTRNIQLETPKEISVLGWGVKITKVWKPSSETLRITFIPFSP